MRLLLIEDEENIATFIVKGLKAAGFAVDHAREGEDGLHLATSEPYDLIVVDLMLPKMDGLALIAELRRRKFSVPVLILSAKRSIDDRVRGLQLGGDDYLTKPFAFSELLARAQALIRRASGQTDPSRLSLGELSMDLSTRTVTRQGQAIELQPLEFALLEYLLRNGGKVVTKTMIMEHVWNYSFNPQTNVVEARICKLRDKIDRNFGTRLIHTVHGVGYVLREGA